MDATTERPCVSWVAAERHPTNTRWGSQARPRALGSEQVELLLIAALRGEQPNRILWITTVEQKLTYGHRSCVSVHGGRRAWPLMAAQTDRVSEVGVLGAQPHMIVIDTDAQRLIAPVLTNVAGLHSCGIVDQQREPVCTDRALPIRAPEGDTPIPVR